MTLLQDIRVKAKHRGLTPWQLVQKIGRLEREADDTTCQLVAMATEIDELTAERNQLADQLDEAQIELAAVREDRDIWHDETVKLRVRFGPQIAAEANEAAVDVPPSIRSIAGPEDEATAPIDVRPLREAAAAGRLGPVTDPGGVRAEEVAS